jgi:hypothetical protein
MDLKHQIEKTYGFDYEILLNTVKFEDLGPYISIRDSQGRSLLDWISHKKTSFYIEIAINIIETYSLLFDESTFYNCTISLNEIVLCKIIDNMSNCMLKYKDRVNNNNLLRILSNSFFSLTGLTPEEKYSITSKVLKYYINKFGILTEPNHLNYNGECVLSFIIRYFWKYNDMYYIFVNFFGILLKPHNIYSIYRDINQYNSKLSINLITCYGILLKKYIYNFRHIGVNKIILIYGRY